MGKDKEKESPNKEQPKQHIALVKREKSSKWSAKKCAKYARKFEDLEQWKAGAPSSFKSAQANGWLKECEKEFRKPAQDGSKYKKSA
mgnify:CR=1 FL=1|jgi:hypothetical protein